MNDGRPRAQLVVFSDDWGRHPSSCQHLVRQLLGRYPALWVNTVGTRPPKLSLEDVGKTAAKLARWTGLRRAPATQQHLPEHLTVINPVMWPGFRSRWQRRFNAGRLARAVNRAMDRVFGQRAADEGGGTAGAAAGQAGGPMRIVVTTIPVTADLVGRLNVDRWVYYCVDDFSVWPGLDASVMQDMERQQVEAVDEVIAVSQTLQDRLAQMGRTATLLTHGIDLAHWTASGGAGGAAAQSAQASQQAPASQTSQTGAAASAAVGRALPTWWSQLRRPIFLFWGLVDRRLDTAWCQALVSGQQDEAGTLVLVGPTQSPDAALLDLTRVWMPGPASYDDLPTLAAAADVLVMPYADLPVTRAMQPLKFKEYLATGRPVVVSKLPATAQWSDAADVVSTAAAFVAASRRRAKEGVPAEQLTARARLKDESWQNKATQFEAVLMGAANV